MAEETIKAHSVDGEHALEVFRYADGKRERDLISDGKPVGRRFTRLQLQSLVLLVDRRNILVSFEELATSVWTTSSTNAERLHDTIRTQVEGLRRNLGNDWIKHDPHKGFTLFSQPSAESRTSESGDRMDEEMSRLVRAGSFVPELFPQQTASEAASSTMAADHEWPDGVAERTYFKYRDQETPVLNTSAAARLIASRYPLYEPISIGDQVFPVTILWENASRLISPDEVLGKPDLAQIEVVTNSGTLDTEAYTTARAFITSKYTDGPIKHESVEFCMNKIDRDGAIPKIDCRLGRYYDCILTQYAMEWELRKHFISKGSVHFLAHGALPLREAVENGRDPVVDGTGRCTAVTVSMLIVFNRPKSGYWTILRKRSTRVGVSAGMLHVVPAGMFEATNGFDDWSLTKMIMREMLEELFGEAEQQGDGEPIFEDHLWHKEPVAFISRSIGNGSAELSLTGICCDFLNLRPEICIVLFVRDRGLTELRQMQLNWEYQPQGPGCAFGTPWDSIDERLNSVKVGEIVPSGLACLLLGRNWMRERHGI